MALAALTLTLTLTFKNGVPCNGCYSCSVVPSIGSVQAMKTLSGWEAVRCDEHQFRAKIKMSNLLEPFWSYRCFN